VCTHSWGLWLRALAGAWLPRVRFTSEWTVIGTVPLRKEPAIVSLIPLHDTLLVLLLAAGPLEHGSDPSLLSLAYHLIDIPDVLLVLVEAHGVHLLLLLLLPASVPLPLHHLRLDVHYGLSSILVHGAL